MNYQTAADQAEKFLIEGGQFRLGKLLTESPHPRTRRLSQVAHDSVTDALKLLFEVDSEVVSTYKKWIGSGAPERICKTVCDILRAGGRIYFTGCGATGRLSIQLTSVWRGFWRQRSPAEREQWEHRVDSVMAGGDFALIKSVEGFEDFTPFGMKQIEDMGVSEGDAVFAITEGGETSFVIGTAWQGLKKGARVYFVYNNPDHILRETVIRGREILDEPRIEKINLTTGPMAIVGSTRMQATSIQLCAMLTVLEMVIRELLSSSEHEGPRLDSASVPADFLAGLEQMHASLMSQEMREQFADLVLLAEKVYGGGKRGTHFADYLAMDVLTDTTERSPTFCIPAFRKWDDRQAADSWTFLFLPYSTSEEAWERLLNRQPYGLSWSDEEITELVGPEEAPKQSEIMRQIGLPEILRFRIGLDGLKHRPILPDGHVVCVVAEQETDRIISPDGSYRVQLEKAVEAGASAVLVWLGRRKKLEEMKQFLASWQVPCRSALVPVAENNLLLDGITRIGIKMLMNALSTCVMVRLGRVLGNCMISVVPSNLKLIDRSTRFIENLTGLPYEDACRMLFESLEYVRPRQMAGKEYPPVVELSVLRARHECSLEEAESHVSEELHHKFNGAKESG